MPQFSVNIVTPAGQALLARASSALQLIYTRIKASETAVTAAEAAASVPADFPVTGTILAASATENVARIVGKISSASLSVAVTLKTFALCAKIDGDAEDAVLAVLSDENASVPLPGPSAVDVNAEIGFLLTITDAGQVTVEVTGAGSVTFGDISRFLSLYKAGDPTTGEAQTVLGAKTFNGPLTTNGALTANGVVEIYGSAYFDDFATFDNGLTTHNDINITGGALSASGGVLTSRVDLGDGLGIGELMVRQSSSGSLFAGAVVTESGALLTGLDVMQDHSYNTSRAQLTAAVEYGTQHDAARIGAFVEDGSAFVYSRVYNLVQPQGREEYEVDPTTCATFEMGATEVAFGIRLDAPEVRVAFGYVDGEPVFYPFNNDVISLGDAGHRWGSLYCTDARVSALYGLAPVQQSGNTGIQMAIGAYTMLTLTALHAQQSPDAMFGSEFTLSSTMEGTSGGGAQKFTTGYKFRAMQTVSWAQDGSNMVATFLAMRVG